MRETKKPELKKITQEELNEKLAEYVRWRDSNPQEGEPFDLSQYDLRGCAFHSEIDLRYINLSGSDLTDANLVKANLAQANLTSANLGCANLSKVDFSYSNLSLANLSGANLSVASFVKIDLNEGLRSSPNRFVIGRSAGALRGAATLIGTNFSGANLSEADLAGVDLTKADFSNAILTDAKFCYHNKDTDKFEGGATLVGTKFLNATMHRADLRGTKTAGMQLGGADVTNAILPDEIKSFEGLKTVEEASKIAKRLFTMLLTALGFSALTILSTKDYLLLTNAITSPLPLIQTPMPLAGFYWIAPFLLTVFFIYFLLNLLHLYKLISRLPAVFPDGTPLDEKIFPWLLNTLVREYFPRLPEKEVSLFWARKSLIVFLAWWTTPIILFSFWFRYLSRHDHLGSDWHIICLAFVIFSVGLTYSKTLRMFKQVSEFTLHLIVIVLATLYLPFFVGKNFFSPIYDSYLKLDSPVKWISFTNEDDYYRQHFADFAEQEVSYKPDNWNSEKPTEGVKGAKLENANLDYAYAHSAFLIKAKLSRASLKDATLTGAILVGAMLDGKADLTNAHLDKANLIGANLTEAILSGVDFTGADLTGANLYKADLTRADLTGVIGIKPEQIKKAKDWQLAFYDKSFNENYLKLSEEEISSALKLFIKESFPTLSDEEVGKLCEKEIKKYRVHYGWPTGEKTK